MCCHSSSKLFNLSSFSFSSYNVLPFRRSVPRVTNELFGPSPWHLTTSARPDPAFFAKDLSDGASGWWRVKTAPLSSVEGGVGR